MQSSQQENQQEQGNMPPVDANTGSCLFNKSGVTVMGVFVPWVAVVIVALLLIWFLHKNGYFNAEVASVMSVTSMPSMPASVGVSANVQSAPSMPSGDVAKFFNHDLW